MITIRGWHGTLPPKMAARLDAFATPVHPNYEWSFNGTIAQFVDQWNDKFLALPQCTDEEEREGRDWDWFIGVTQFNGFGQR